ncbi:uncharacterized protein [Arachis hypogaea]|uniref:uncharacterized protein n=1 Tax=Arachis hypogaea TaxID=3818 RepID=UPI003B2284AC
MHPSDQNKTAFITEYGNYCYKVMPFNLKNAGGIYQRLMDKVFAKQIGRNIEVYVDDMVAKTKFGNNHLNDLAEIFAQLRKYNMQLNSEKCTFGVQSGKFLGFMLTNREREKKQYPIYFTSKTLQNAELRYPSIEKLALALFLADFIAEFLVPSTTEDYIEWSLYVDGSSNPQGCGTSIILDDSHGNVIEHSLNFLFKASNNQSEYEALIAGLRLAADLNITELKVYCDSLLIVQQHIPRESNGRADILSKLASTQPNGSSLYQSTLFKPSIELTQILSVTQEADYEDSLVHYLNVFAEQKPSLHLLRRMKGFVDLKIKQHFSLVEHPQTNGLREAANKAILHALRKKLDDAKGLWAELIPKIIWGYNTTIHSTTKETPFRLVYGSDAMIPVEISQSSLRTEMADHTTKDIARQSKLDLVEEVRSSTAIKHLAMQQHIARRYNKRLHPRSFQVNDLVLRKTEQARRPSTHGKLAANWEGPYRVTEVIGNGAY